MKIRSDRRSAMLVASTALLLGLAPAYAGEDANRAEAYFQAIASGDAETIASFYAENAEFRWVGGPLAGFYKGKQDIKGVWEKFSAAAGKFTHEVVELNETPQGQGSTVNAVVTFKGATDVPVRFALTYKGGKIASETWQVDRSATVAKTEPKAEDKPEAKPDTAVAKAEPKPEEKPEPIENTRPETIATVQTTPTRAAEETAPRTEKADNEQSDYLPKSQKKSSSAHKAAAAPADTKTPADSKPVAKSKSADTRKGPRKKRRHDDGYDEYDDYAYDYAPRYRRYRDYDRYDDYDRGRYTVYGPGPGIGFGIGIGRGFIGLGWGGGYRRYGGY